MDALIEAQHFEHLEHLSIKENRINQEAVRILRRLCEQGAVLAAAFHVAVVSVLFAFYLAGLLLPEDSKQAPSPYGALAAETTTLTA
jgi:hypothetical protein